MMEITLTKQQARQFILLKQGLLGEHRFAGKDGIVAYVRQAGCIQFDPIDVCGKNAELVLQSRVKGFQKKMLSELLYEDRWLFDFFDKNLAIMELTDWPYLERIREGYRQKSRGKVEVVPKELLMMPDPYPEDIDHMKWRVLRRISAIGLLWNRPSDAWLGIWNFHAQDRLDAFEGLLSEGRILPVRVEGCKDLFYCRKEDEQLIHSLSELTIGKPRTELLAPLDCMLWDRKLIKELFDFDYKWEIYTPEAQRKYGYYVLPVLSGERLIGRVEVISATKQDALLVKNLWLEKGVKPTKKLAGELDRCFVRFMKFHGLKKLVYEKTIFD